jgi:uncharacterized protein (TIGR00251 family)
MKPPFSLQGNDILLTVRLTPRAGRDAVAGVVDCGDGRTALAIRIAAPPVEGAANQALIALLAKRLRIPRSAVTIESGESARLKRVRLAGIGAVDLAALL